MESYPKKCWPSQTLLCVQSFDLLARLGGTALLMRLYGKFLVVNSEIPPRRAGLLSYKQK